MVATYRLILHGWAWHTPVELALINTACLNERLDWQFVLKQQEAVTCQHNTVSSNRCYSQIRQPNFYLPQHTWSLMNHFWTGPCRANLHRWGLAQSPSCDCGQRQTMNHIVDAHQLTKFESGLDLIHKVDDEAAVGFGWGGVHRDCRCPPSPLSSPRSTKIQKKQWRTIRMLG